MRRLSKLPPMTGMTALQTLIADENKLSQLPRVSSVLHPLSVRE